MSQQQSKIGAILALIGGALALLAFFALPLFSVLSISVSASQIATGFGGLLNSSNSNSSFQAMWLGIVPPLIVAILSVTILASKPAAVPFPPPGYNPAYPPTGYGYPPPVPVAHRQGGAGKGASTGIIICSVINLLLVIIFYAAAANNFSRSSSSTIVSFSGVTAASFLAAGFWIYALAVLAMLVGGIVQLRSSSS